MTRLLYAVFGASLALYVAMIALHAIYLGPPMGETAVPDVRMTGYSVQDMRVFLDGLDTAELRWIYFDVLGWLDTFFPACLTLAMVLVFHRLDPEAVPQRTALYAVLPLAYMIADYIENASLDRLRETMDAADFAVTVQAASTVTIAKFILVFIALIPMARRIVRRMGRVRREG